MLKCFRRPSFLQKKMLMPKLFHKARVDLRDSADDELRLANNLAAFVLTIMYLGYNHS